MFARIYVISVLCIFTVICCWNKHLQRASELLQDESSVAYAWFLNQNGS